MTTLYLGMIDDSDEDNSTVKRLKVDPAHRNAHLALRNQTQLLAEWTHQKDRSLRMGGALGKKPDEALHSMNPATKDELVSALMDLHADNDKLKDNLVSKARLRACIRELPMQCARISCGALVAGLIAALFVVAIHPLDN